MAPSPSVDPADRDGGLDATEERLLLDLARTSIAGGLRGDGPLTVDVYELSPPLQEPGAAFVTVLVDGELNGCIGSLWPQDPLAQAVAKHAWQAAYADPRLPRLTAAEFPARTEIEISVLSPLVEVPAAKAVEVVNVLRPGVDGLLLTGGGRRATLLPAVWDRIPDAETFVRTVLQKGGWPRGAWSSDMRAWTYTAHKAVGKGSHAS
jgi:AmmeMemoRadiSam system protein A